MTVTQVDLSILIVGYNSCSYLEACLGSIAGAISVPSYEVLFVNNGTDSSEEFIRSAYPQVRVLDSRGNVGFAAANNYLADHARGRWLLLLNPDTKLLPGALDSLLEAADKYPEYEVLGGVTVGVDGEIQQRAQIELPSLPRMVRALASRQSRRPVSRPDQPVREVEALNGGFMMVSHECWNRLGGLDRTFFLYAEELDFFRRLRDQGGRAAQIMGSRVFHDMGSGDVYSPSRIRFLVTGNAHYFHKHFTPPYAYACIFLMWATMMKRYLGGRLLSRRGGRYARMAQAFAPVARAPWTWMWGYRSAGADPRHGA